MSRIFTIAGVAVVSCLLATGVYAQQKGMGGMGGMSGQQGMGGMGGMSGMSGMAGKVCKDKAGKEIPCPQDQKGMSGMSGDKKKK